VRRTPFPVTARAHALRTLADRSGPLRQTAPDPQLRRAARLVHDRTAGVFGPFTGRLSPHAAALVAAWADDRVHSASALEQWLECPHAYLLGAVLRVRPVDNPEELLSMPPAEQGTLVHDVLDRWLADRIAAGVPAPEEPWPADAVAGLRGHALAALELAEHAGGTGHPLLWSRDRARLLADLSAFVARDEERRRVDRLRPHATELSFGGGGDVPELRIDLDDGRVVRVGGRIDRIDVAADGTVFVADYKTGRADRYRDLSGDDPLAGNTKLQLPIYALAVRDDHADAPAVHAEYWFISSRGYGRRIGYRLTDGAVAALRTVLTVIVDGIGGGLFPMRPPAGPSFGFVRCPWCDPDGLGAADAHRAWERIRLDPALRAYTTAVEPDALVGAGLEPERRA
jgi:ATP-dependent helicase/nuclease subunit B